jgi:hypothetical protein
MGEHVHYAMMGLLVLLAPLQAGERSGTPRQRYEALLKRLPSLRVSTPTTQRKPRPPLNPSWTSPESIPTMMLRSTPWDGSRKSLLSLRHLVVATRNCVHCGKRVLAEPNEIA